MEALHRAGGFTHGFTFSHNPVTAAACLATLEILERESLVERAPDDGGDAARAGSPRWPRTRTWATCGAGPDARRSSSWPTRPRGGPFPRAEKKAEAWSRRCFENGLVVYPSTGCATGTEGDLVMLAPPFVVTEEQLEEIVGDPRPRS